MAKRKRATKNAKVKDEPDVEVKKEVDVKPDPDGNDNDQDENQYAGLTEYEIQRLHIIQQNRERLLALGLPGLAVKFQQMTQPPPKPRAKPAKKKPVKKVKKEPVVTAEGVVIKEEDDGGMRRSSRLRNQAAKPKPETTEEQFNRELGEFIVDGECPKCGKIVEKNHRNHLINCSGVAREPGKYRGREKEIMELSEEDRKDAKKRMMARMKALDLSGLVDFDSEAAKFIVIGSKGDPYTIVLNDTKHKCTCLDHRFRRHNCKHICLVLKQLGILEEEQGSWKGAVEGQLDELIAQSQVGGPSLHPEEKPPVDKEALEALKFAAI